jgi:MFS family permease
VDLTGYLLAATVVTPMYGKLSDIHGRRKMLQIAISTFVVDCLRHVGVGLHFGGSAKSDKLGGG